MLAYASTIHTLSPGDIILTSTPPGLVDLEVGQHVRASLSYEGKVMDAIELDVVQRKGGFSRAGGHWLDEL